MKHINELSTAPKIVDVILHKNKYFTQRFLVLDRRPTFRYAKKRIGTNTWLLSEDGIFRSAYYYDRPTPRWEAFAGRQFDILMADGTVEKAIGQWWDGYPYDDVVSVGIATIEGLKECNVFMGGRVRKDVAENVFANYANPSNNCNKYSPRDKDYGEHIITSRWQAEA